MGYNVRKALAKARRPFDVVRYKDGAVGFITEVNINDAQPELEHQLSYAIHWLCGSDLHFAWWAHDTPGLTFHENLFEVFAAHMAHPFGCGRTSLERVLKG